MAGISLRSYHAEIERLIEAGRTEEAIAHCRHILGQYPKYVNTYRLLGKAYLESQQYGYATDVLQRVLSSVPDDFVAHIGMSLIREDEGNLDEAIYHMERAYEVKPNNVAIQDELRRLYEKRDGIQVAKIHLTRGALARMYYAGGHYSQAIADILAALSEDPNRLDLQLLLACAYDKADNVPQAVQVAKNILSRLPFCLEANRILAERLAGGEHDSEAQVYRQRLIALEPYYAYTNSTYPTPQEVPDQAITIEKLIWQAGQSAVSKQPTWATSLGVSLGETGESTEKMPEWLSGVGTPVSASSETVSPFATVPLPPGSSQPSLPAEIMPPVETSAESLIPTQSAAEEEIPDWMKAAGWGPSTGSFQESTPPSIPAEAISPEAEEAAALASGELPDWLKAMAPPDLILPTAEEATQEDLQWLEQILPGTPATPETETTREITGATEPSEVPEWLQSLGLESPAETPPATAESFEIPTPAEPETAAPDWLQGLSSQAPPIVSELAEEETPAFAQEEELPDWLRFDSGEPKEEPPFTAETPSEPAAEIPEWLQGLGTEEETLVPLEPSIEEEAPAEPAAEIPEWLQGLGTEEETLVPLEPSAEEEALAEPAAEIPEWLQGLGIEEETPVPLEPSIEEEAPAEPAAEIPEWLQGLGAEKFPSPAEVFGEQAFGEEPFAAEAPAEPAAEIPEWLQGLGVEELPTPAEAVGEQVFGEEPFAAEAPAEPAAEIPEWLQGLGAEELPSPAEAVGEQVFGEEPFAEEMPAEPAAEIPEWLQGLGAEELPSPAEVVGEQAFGEEPFAAEAPAEPAAEIPEWLQGLGAEEIPTAAEALKAEEARVEPAVEPSAEIPSWLMADHPIEEEEEILAEGSLQPGEEEVQPTTAIPDWLLEEEPVESEARTTITEEELAVSVEDTRPTRVRPAEVETAATPEAEFSQPAAAEVPSTPPSHEVDLEAAFAWLESLAVKQGAEEALLLSPEERREEPPEWVLEEASRSRADEAATAPLVSTVAEQTVAEQLPIPEESDIESAPAEVIASGAETPPFSAEIPSFASEALTAEEQPPVGEFPTPAVETPTAEEAPAPGIAETLPIEAAPAPILSDEDAAFAWLESLAVRQGAEEALLLKPEERREEPPDWVLQQVSEVAPLREEAPGETIEAPPLSTAEPALGVGLSLAEVPESPVEAPPPEEGIGIATEAETPPIEVLEVAPLTTAPEAESTEVTAELPAEEPELPAWLAGPETEPEVVEWTPPPVTPVQTYDLNKISLAELERLPGVGFINAQRIVSHRELEGEFASVDDLLAVPGISAALLDMVRDYLYVVPRAVQAPPVTLEQAAEPLPAITQAAPEELVSLLADLQSRIEANQGLAAVAERLEALAAEYPEELEIWQTLGDAYLRMEKTKEALRAYAKAEQLLQA